MSEYLSWQPPPRRRTGAEAAGTSMAVLLRAASAALDALARRVEARQSERPVQRDGSVVEFHADAGAPEGALYVDGRLVGWIDGVQRL